MEGGKYSFNYSDSGDNGDFAFSVKEDTKLGFINLPIGVKYYVVDRVSIEAGYQIGYLVSAKSDYDFYMDTDGDIISDSGKEDIKDDVKAFNSSLNLGIGYELKSNFFSSAI